MGTKTCERCGVELDKKRANQFDSTFGGSQEARQTGEKLKLCRDCLFVKFSEYLSNYGFRALVVYPMRDKHVNAYVFYSLHEMETAKGGGRYSAWPRRYIDQIRQILPPPNTVCQSCGTNKAMFAWCSPEIYRNNYTRDKLELEGTYRRDYLCNNCLLVQVKTKVTENNNVFDLFTPPVDGEGLLTSWDI